MELLFESRIEVAGIEGKIYAVQMSPEVHPGPVHAPDPSIVVDGAGASIYGTVLREGGIYRMWYQAWPKDWDGHNAVLVCYAESDDGIHWRRPVLNLVDYHGTSNNLCDMSFHSPSVFVDPHAPSSHRYRATGWLDAGDLAAGKKAHTRGYYTAHSSDGLKWHLDSETPCWNSSDVITSIYHPQQDRGIVALKYSHNILNVPRRSIWMADLIDGEWSTERCALVPDEYDDICAISRGYASGDYYGMGMMPAGSGTVGFIWQFRHTLPRTLTRETGVFGQVDVSLAYQPGPGHRWLHSPGRADFLTHGTFSWDQGGVYTASCPVEVGDTQRLYYSGSLHSHGYYVNDQWEISDKWKQELISQGFAAINFASWKRDRLFGFRGDPEGTLTINLGKRQKPFELLLNYKTEPGGHVRVEVPGAEQHGLTKATPMHGDALEATVTWKSGGIVQPKNGESMSAKIYLERSDVYAYGIREL